MSDLHSAQAIGNRISTLRKSKELTQATLAKLCSISQQTVGALEVGKVSDPRHLPIIAQVLNVSVEYLRYGRSKGVPIISNRASSDSFPFNDGEVPPETKMLLNVPKHSSVCFAFVLDDNACDKSGILRGDFVAVEPKIEAQPGRLVCVRYRGEFTVRRYRDMGVAVQYASDNEDYATLDDTQAEYVGSVLQVVRNFN